MDDETTEKLFDDGGIVGTVLDDRYRIECVLGAGGMGTVYQARQLSVDRTVAVKVLDELGNTQHIERFLREARVIAQIAHPNVVQLIDFGRRDSDGLLFLVMEHVTGTQLGELLRSQRLHPNLAIEIAAQIAAGLGEAHAQHIVHRDLKPGNVIVSVGSDGGVRVKVLDFGVAHVFEERDLTRTGQVCGTPAFMAPEQVRGDVVTPATDVYALGLCLYQMLGGFRPFSGSPLEVAVKQVHSTFPSLRDLARRGEVPERLIELCERMIAKEPSQRPEHGNAAQAALFEVRSMLGEGAIRLGVDDPWRDMVHPAYASHGGGELLLGAQVPAPWSSSSVRPLVGTAANPPLSPALARTGTLEPAKRPAGASSAPSAVAGADWAAFQQHQTGPHTRPAQIIDPNLEPSGRFQVFAVLPPDLSTSENVPIASMASAASRVEPRAVAPAEPESLLQLDISSPVLTPRGSAPLEPSAPADTQVGPQGLEARDAIRTALVMVLAFVIVAGVGLVLIETGGWPLRTSPQPDRNEAAEFGAASTEAAQQSEQTEQRAVDEAEPSPHPHRNAPAPDSNDRASTKAAAKARKTAAPQRTPRKPEGPIDLFDGQMPADTPVRAVVIEEAEW